MKLRNVFLLTIISIFLIVIIIVSFIIIYSINTSMESQIRDYLYSSSRARAENIKTFLNGQKDTAKIVSTKSIYIDYLNNPGLVSNSNLIDRQMTDIKKSDEYIIEVFIINSQGKIAMSTDKNQIGADKSTDSYFINGQKDIYIKDTYYSTFISKLNYVVAAPIIDSVTNKTLGVSVIRYNPEVYYRLVDSENGMGKTEENFLVNHDKYFISPSLFLGESVILTKKVDTENVNNCYSKLEVDYVNKNGYSGLKQYLNGDIVVEAKDYRNVDVIATHDYITETGWCLVTKVDKSEFMAPIYQLITTTLLVIAGSVIIWIMLSLFIVSRLTKPISKLTQTVKNAIEGDLSVRSNNKSKNEIGRLAQNFNMLLQKITDTNSSINKQVDDQTHEILLRDTELNDRQSTILNILDDIEDEKTKAEILADDLKKFQMAVEGASDHIVITDPDGVVLFANSGAERISGYSKAEIIGKKAGSSELWGGQMSIEIYKKFWETIKIDKKAYSGVFDNIRKSGEKYEAVATITPILNELNEVIYFVGIERDVTKEKEIDRTKTEFVSLASHQLRTPLSAINWYAEMILDGDAGKINKQQRLYLSEIYRGNQRMVELVNSLLNVSRLDLGTFEIKPQLFDIGLIIDDIANEMKHSLIEKNQKLITNKPDDIPKINADQKLMRIIMQNLISNAIKYSPKNSNITVSITYNSDNIKSAFEIKITDHGYGIPNDQKDKIFTKLFRADNVRELDTEGTGLGLYIVKSILDEADGKISFTSVEKKGTTFTVTLPKSGMKQKSGDKTIN